MPGAGPGAVPGGAVPGATQTTIATLATTARQNKVSSVRFMSLQEKDGKYTLPGATKEAIKAMPRFEYAKKK